MDIPSNRNELILTEIDKIVVNFLNICDIINLPTVDRYFQYIVRSNPKFIKWKTLEKEIQLLRSSTFTFTTTYFIQACRFGYSDLCLDLFETQFSRIIKYDCVPAFRTSCKNDHFEIVQWLFHILLSSHRSRDKYHFAQLINDNAGCCNITIRMWLDDELRKFF
jgi:hypothetical protein